MDNGKYDIVDDETGEITEGPAPQQRYEPDPEPQPRYSAAPIGQEIIPPGYDRAADGAVMRTEASTTGHLIDMLENGEFSQEVITQLRQLADKMTRIAKPPATRPRAR